jgi:hypothetical protein
MEAPMEEYLTVQELSTKIKYNKQSLYNMIYSKKLILGKHYFKPTGKKILFKWSAVKKWLGDDGTYDEPDSPLSDAPISSQDNDGEKNEDNIKRKPNIECVINI